MKKVLIVSDAWHPQVNGVVVAIERTMAELKHRGFEVELIHPGPYFTIPLPTYPEIRLAIFSWFKVARRLRDFSPDYVHISTEGPLGLAARSYCKRRGLKFTTSYHTHFQLYIHVRFRMFLGLAYGLLNWFHKVATRTMVVTESLKSALEAHNFKHLVIWPLGVDSNQFVRNLGAGGTLKKPVFTFFSRLAPEKSPDDFFKLDLPGTKLVIGDGPERSKFETVYKTDTVFVGYKKGKELIDLLSQSDVMIFPSRTETLGLVVLESLSCGVPVAAYDVMGPRDILTSGVDGYLGDYLREGALKCLTLDRAKCRETALKYSWEKSADAFIANLVPVK